MFLNNLDKDTKNIDIWLIFPLLILFIELFRHIISFYNKKLIFSFYLEKMLYIRTDINHNFEKIWNVIIFYSYPYY